MPLRRWQLAADATIIEGPGSTGAVTISAGGHAVALGVLPPALRVALAGLRDGREAEEAAGEVMAAGGLTDLARWSYLVDVLLAAGALRCTLLAEHGGPLATFAVSAPGPALSLEPLRADEAVTLSRFASLRPLDGVLVLGSPLGRCRITLHDVRLAAVVATLAQPSAAAPIATATGLENAVVAAFLGLLRGAALLATQDEMGIGATLALWEVEDAVFHSHSRLGHRHQAYGATYRGRGRLPAPPAIAAAEGPIIPLPTPGRATSPGANRPFFAVLEARRSLRPRGVTPLDLTVLGEFLHHAARNRQVPAFGQDGMEWISRPYPGAGGCHPIEVHVLAHRCTPLDRGLYRYDPAGHGLVALGAAPGHMDKLLADARRAARLAADPPVLIILAARFARAIWKYEGIAYANILKDAGGLIQTMYLVATAMGLAPCALGGGDAACFAAAVGKGVWEQSSVGEFILGHSRESDP